MFLETDRESDNEVKIREMYADVGLRAAVGASADAAASSSDESRFELSLDALYSYPCDEALVASGYLDTRLNSEVDLSYGIIKNTSAPHASRASLISAKLEADSSQASTL